MEFWFSILMRYVVNDWLVVLSIWASDPACPERDTSY